MSNEDTGWRDRLRDAIRKDGRPLYKLSEAMGRASTYLGQVLKDEKVPSVENLIKLCKVMDVDPAYILSGVTLTYKGQRLYDRWQSLSEMDQAMVEELLMRLSMDSARRDASNK